MSRDELIVEKCKTQTIKQTAIEFGLSPNQVKYKLEKARGIHLSWDRSTAFERWYSAFRLNNHRAPTALEGWLAALEHRNE